MAINSALAQKLLNAGVPWAAAVALADPDSDAIAGVAVADVAALTSPADIAAAYVEADMQALRDDVAAVRTTLNALLASLRTAGVIAV